MQNESEKKEKHKKKYAKKNIERNKIKFCALYIIKIKKLKIIYFIN